MEPHGKKNNAVDFFEMVRNNYPLSQKVWRDEKGCLSSTEKTAVWLTVDIDRQQDCTILG